MTTCAKCKKDITYQDRFPVYELEPQPRSLRFNEDFPRSPKVDDIKTYCRECATQKWLNGGNP